MPGTTLGFNFNGFRVKPHSCPGYLLEMM
jgi:hypothetical protein